MVGNINMSDMNSYKQKQENILKQKNLGFFSLEESTFKMKKADWLDMVIFTPNVQDYIKRQSNYLNSSSNLDGLLESALNFLDINDSASVNKILEESSSTH